MHHIATVLMGGVESRKQDKHNVAVQPAIEAYMLICLYRQPCHRSHDCTVLIWSACSLQLALPFLCSASSRTWLKVWRYSGFHCCAVINLICSIGTHAITHIGAWQIRYLYRWPLEHGELYHHAARGVCRTRPEAKPGNRGAAVLWMSGATARQGLGSSCAALCKTNLAGAVAAVAMRFDLLLYTY